ncbi:MAG: DNA-processing protein DprA [Lachnospiraceae bacterium]|nr:DNA-processing protein DprA [Lachnospiraceae bacterium]
MTDKEYALWLSTIDFNLGLKKINALLNIFGTAEAIYNSTPETIEKTGILNKKLLDKYIEHKNLNKFKETLDYLHKQHINFTYYGSDDYPEKLLNIDNAPFGLYYLGNLPDSKKKCIAIVGARNCSHEGKEIAKKLSKELVENGIEIISGMARGIDISAHRGALEVLNGKTYAVLGCSVDICYPRENIAAYMDIQENGGIISELPPETQPLSRNFPIRNRIISGLSDGVLVVQAGEKSGSIITAGMALDQGKDLYVVPGSIMNPLYKGSNYLIKTGSIPVTGVSDILDGLNIIRDENVGDLKLKNSDNLPETHKMVYECLSLNPVHVSQIVGNTGLDYAMVMKALIYLELKGFVKDLGNKYYAVLL